MASNNAKLGGISVPALELLASSSHWQYFFCWFAYFFNFFNFHLGNFSFHSLKFLPSNYSTQREKRWQKKIPAKQFFLSKNSGKIHKTGVWLETEATTVLYRFEAEHEMKWNDSPLLFPVHAKDNNTTNTNNEEKFFLRRRIGHAVAVWATRRWRMRALAVLVVSASGSSSKTEQFSTLDSLRALAKLVR